MVAPRLANLEGLMSFDDDLDAVSEAPARHVPCDSDLERKLSVALNADSSSHRDLGSGGRLQAGTLREPDAGPILVVAGTETAALKSTSGSTYSISRS